MAASRHPRGFTLIEVVVALAVFALCVGAVLESFRGAAVRATQARRQETALLVGQSVLARIRATEDFTAQQRGDAEAGVRWQADVTREPVEVGTGNPFVPYRVVVSVFEHDRAEASVVLRSIELGLAP
jgi:prepilin-type N-terminal cleavage/methylation domain-containing protein